MSKIRTANASAELATLLDYTQKNINSALETGYAVAIGHPREDTLAVLGPWLASIEARGFELITVSSLLEKPASVLVQAPELRL